MIPRLSPAATRRALAQTLSKAQSVELVVMAWAPPVILCRTLNSAQPILLRPTPASFAAAEAHILTVAPSGPVLATKFVLLSGKVKSARLDAAALRLTPLKLRDEVLWNPLEEYWGEDGEAISPRWKPIIAAGPRPSFEMEQALPGFDPGDPETDPIGEAADLMESGDYEAATTVLHECLKADLRVLDAYAHLGNIAFGEGRRAKSVELARRRYAAGVAIGELSLGSDFRGLLPWSRIDNRPFLRCLHGLALCHWALGEPDAAAKIFERLLWLNPTDNQGARFCLAEVEAGSEFKNSQL